MLSINKTYNIMLKRISETGNLNIKIKGQNVKYQFKTKL